MSSRFSFLAFALLLVTSTTVASFQAPRHSISYPHHGAQQRRLQLSRFYPATTKADTSGSRRRSLSITPTGSATNYCRPELALALASSDGNSEETTDAAVKMEKKVAGRKKRVIIGYRLSAAIYAVLGLVLMAPAVSKPALIFQAMNPASAPFLAAGTAHILAEAATHNRLSSETYQRLNLVLSKFGFLWLLAAFLVRGQTSQAAKMVGHPLVLLASLSAGINGIKGWAYGAKGWDKADQSTTYIKAFLAVPQTMLQLLVSLPKNNRASLYKGASVCALLLIFYKVTTIGRLLSSTATASVAGFHVITLAKFVLLGTTTLTLMDAANRDRLKGTTFIQLNFLSAFVWLAMGGCVYDAGNVARAILYTLFASFSFLTGATFYMEKKEA